LYLEPVGREIVVSWFVSTSMLLQSFFLVVYHMEWRLKWELAWAISNDVIRKEIVVIRITGIMKWRV